MTTSESLVKKLDHLFICPAEWSRTMAFWRDTLGLPVLQDWSSESYHGASLALGESRITIAEHEPERDEELGFQVRTGQPYIYLHVGDIDAVAKRLAHLRHPNVGPVKELHWGPRMLTLRDPDGIPVMLLESRP